MVISTGNSISLESEKAGNEIQVVEFCLGGETFAVNLFDVREIVEASRITPVPHAASHIKGIIDLRGEITTIVDLKKILQISESKKVKTDEDGGDSSRFIVLDESVTKVKTGIVVDDVTSVLNVPTSEIDQATHDADSYILGIIKKSVGDKEEGRKELVIWIDVRALLQSV